jgi:hypothetical protein
MLSIELVITADFLCKSLHCKNYIIVLLIMVKIYSGSVGGNTLVYVVRFICKRSVPGLDPMGVNCY